MEIRRLPGNPRRNGRYGKKPLLALAAAEPGHGRCPLLRLWPAGPCPDGKDLGYLPGDIAEKDQSLDATDLRNIAVSLRSLQPGKRGKAKSERTEGKGLKYPTQAARGAHGVRNPLKSRGADLYRGRSIPNQFIVVDEAQNLTPHEVKTILTRRVRLKDRSSRGPYQIDNPFVDAASNGPFPTSSVDSVVSQKAGHVTLIRGKDPAWRKKRQDSCRTERSSVKPFDKH